MAKVTMYHGVDPTDGRDSLIAVSDGVCACNFDTPNSRWITPESFSSMDEWATQPLPECLSSFFTDDNTEVLWEADL